MQLSNWQDVLFRIAIMLDRPFVRVVEKKNLKSIHIIDAVPDQDPLEEL
jgi:hypothetical protein